MVDGSGPHHRLEHVELGVAEVAHEAEVDERDAPVAVEQVVARMRIAVERAHPVQAAEHEPEQPLAGEVALLLVPPEHVAPRRAGDQLAGQHASRRQSRQDGRHMDERVAAVELDETRLVGGLPAVVELLGDPLLDLGDQLRGVEPAESLAQQRAEQIRVGEIGFDGFGDAGILHLDRDGHLFAGVGVDGDGAVHLADRRCGDRFRVPLHEHVGGRATELALDDLGGQVGGHRRRIGLQ